MTETAATAIGRYAQVRARTVALCAPLALEDHVPQPVPEASPPKWHLGHTSWFFETLVLQPNRPSTRAFDPRYGYLFNSYYESVGPRIQRAERGQLSRPTVAEVQAYRAHVDAGMHSLLDGTLAPDVVALVELGLQHEQQHQELLVTDLKAVLAHSGLDPSYDPTGRGPLDLAAEHAPAPGSAAEWVAWDGGPAEIGHAAPAFAFDNERPRHRQHVPAVELRRRLVTNDEYLAFMGDGGYERFEFWHAEGWDWVQSLTLRAPLYWRRDPETARGWRHFTLRGAQPLDGEAPVTHLSYYEAHAFCQWAGWRLPTEAEWELLAPCFEWGRRWEWTSSAYQPYPGFRPGAGAVGEYNGKFMVGQQVLRGASFATPPGHSRISYRNFFHPPLRWQYTGIRPARDR